jgi:hypothetical protein
MNSLDESATIKAVSKWARRILTEGAVATLMIERKLRPLLRRPAMHKKIRERDYGANKKVSFGLAPGTDGSKV